jgi:hypothetical protein
MNYFAHGLRFVDRPWFLAGTAVPDWLSVADRRVRMRAAKVQPFVDGSGSPAAELAAGVLQHLDDDRWFHQTPAFFETTGAIARLFRELLGPEDGFRPGFLGHITTELLLDAVLIDRDLHRLDAYYAALDRIDPARIEQNVSAMAREASTRLATFVSLFRETQFLRDYRDSQRLLFRLNQVMQRVKLKPLPARTAKLLETARTIVDERADELLPTDRYQASHFAA